MVFNENTTYDFFLLSKQGRTQLIYSTPRLAWFLSQTITWFATDRNVQRKKSSKPTLVSSGGTVKKFTLQLRYNKLFSFSILKISSNNSQVIPCLSKFLEF